MTTVTYIWILQFHADNLSSAHVYLRLKPGDSWTSIPQTLLEDCAQLTKANSIEGIYYLLSPSNQSFKTVRTIVQIYQQFAR